MKRELLILLLCIICSFSKLHSTSLTYEVKCYSPQHGKDLQSGKWYWNVGCNGCFYFEQYGTGCKTWDESNNFRCFFLVGGCFFNGSGGLRVQNPTGNKAFFNLREKSTKQYPSEVQTRGVNSAISITENDFLSLIQPNKVQTSISFEQNQAITFNVGTADNMNPQTWTIPSLSGIANGKELLYFVDPTSVPTTARVTGATHVGKKEIVDEEGHFLTEYTHFKFETGQDLMEMGSSFVNQSNNAIVNHGESTAQIFADSPLDLGDDFTTDVTEYYDDDETLPFDKTSTHVTVDAFGTINNPYTGTTHQCLRLTLNETLEEYETDENTPDQTTTTRYYMWVTKEGFRFTVKDPVASPTVNTMSMVTFATATVLNVELIDFQGFAKEKGVDLTWTTANEMTNAGFDIERSNDGQTFEKIGFVKGNGSTNTQKSYSFTDEHPLSKTTYYRLQQVDFDGSKVRSNVISIATKSPKATLKVYPNPSSENQISIELAENTEGVEVYNSTGQLVFQQKTKTLTNLKVDISSWVNGVYFVKSGNDMLKFIKQL